VYIPRDHYTQDSKGYAFVRFLKQDDADEAFEKMQGYVMNGRELRVAFAQRRRPENPREHYRGRDEPR
jgi:RNA recognition motif-containing protein